MEDTNSFLGFTLAELLAVIIIVSILTGLGVGYYKRSVEQSRFSEGLAAASAVVEALNRTYFDEQLEGNQLADDQVHSFKTLDVVVGGGSGDNYQNTKHFDVYIEENDGQEVVRAYRGGKDGLYYIQMYPNYAAGTKQDQISCVGNGEDGVAFCQAMGYVNCSTDGCTK